MLGPYSAVRSTIELDTSSWPVVVVTPPDKPLSDASIDEFMVRWAQMTRDRKGQYVCVHDVRYAPPMSTAHRKKMTDMMNDYRAELAVQCAGVAMVFDSVLMRAMLTAFMWMFRPPYPTQVCSNLEDAMRWGQARLAVRRRPLAP